MSKKSVRDIDVSRKRVLVRVDLNVPLDEETGVITDYTRIRAVLPTIEYLIDKRARVILCSHLGRPDGKVVEKLRLTQVAEQLSKLLGKKVATASDCIGADVEKAAAKLKDGDVLLLENLRFHAEEEKNDPQFAQAISKLADIYVNDAFGTAHRSHASVVGVARYLPAVAGLLLEKEIGVMGKALTDPARPFAALIGGAKISDKIGVMENILEKVDYLLVAGGMCATFFKALKYDVGASSVEEDKLDLARRLMDRADKRGIKLMLPSDVVVGNRFSADAESKVVSASNIPAGWYIMDIGPQTLGTFVATLRECETIIWNGPVGVFEYAEFSKGTRDIANLLARLDATTIIGGGSTAEAVEKIGLADQMTHVSTGGGASLKFLEGKTLPGVAALQDKEN